MDKQEKIDQLFNQLYKPSGIMYHDSELFQEYQYELANGDYWSNYGRIIELLQKGCDVRTGWTQSKEGRANRWIFYEAPDDQQFEVMSNV
ncbi:MAG: hypothetical protein ACOC4Y_01510 [bacterium]